MTEHDRSSFPVIKLTLLVAGVIGGCALYWALFLREPKSLPEPAAPPAPVPASHGSLPFGEVGTTGLPTLAYALDATSIGAYLPLVHGYQIAPPKDWLDTTAEARNERTHSEDMPLLWAFKPPTEDGAMMIRHVPHPPPGRTFLDLESATERAMRGTDGTNHVNRVSFEHAGCAVHRVSTSAPGLYTVTHFVMLSQGGALQIDYIVNAARLDESLGAALMSSFVSLALRD